MLLEVFFGFQARGLPQSWGATEWRCVPMVLIPVVLVTHDEQDVADPQRVLHLRATTEENQAHV